MPRGKYYLVIYYLMSIGYCTASVSLRVHEAPVLESAPPDAGTDNTDDLLNGDQRQKNVFQFPRGGCMLCSCVANASNVLSWQMHIAFCDFLSSFCTSMLHHDYASMLSKLDLALMFTANSFFRVYCSW
jgi:hypothetical protein